MKIYFATWLVDKAHGTALTKKKVKNRLLSYFFLQSQEVPQEGFEEYIQTGKYDPKKKK